MYKTNYLWAQLASVPTSCFTCHTQFGFIPWLFIIIISFTDFICLSYILKEFNVSKHSAEGLFSPELMASWTEGYPDEKGRSHVYMYIDCISLDSKEDICFSDKLFWLLKQFSLSRTAPSSPNGAINHAVGQSESLSPGVGKEREKYKLWYQGKKISIQDNKY